MSQAISKGAVPPNRDADTLYVMDKPLYRTSVKNKEGSCDGIVPCKAANKIAIINKPKKISTLLPVSIRIKAGTYNVINPIKHPIIKRVFPIRSSKYPITKTIGIILNMINKLRSRPFVLTYPNSSDKRDGIYVNSVYTVTL